MIDGIKNLWVWLYGLLEKFDVAHYINAIKEPLAQYTGWLNWLIPFGDILSIYTVWLACIGAYFVFSAVKPFITNIISRLFKKGD